MKMFTHSQTIQGVGLYEFLPSAEHNWSYLKISWLF